jgi:aspartate aminotransferase
MTVRSSPVPQSRNVQQMQESITMSITARAVAMKREGIDVVGLSAGEPDFDTPAHIKAAGIRAIEAGFTKYDSPGSGILPLKEAIARKLKEDNGLDYSPQQITVNNGAKNTIFVALVSMLNRDDEVIVPTPYWVSYVEQPKIVGAIPRVVETRAENGLKLTPEELRQAITPNTRLLFLCTPSNPSGAVYTREELGALAEVLIEHGIYVISDEIYEKLVYDDTEHHSIASINAAVKDLTIVVNGLSKSHAMTGWRVGYAAAAAPIIGAMNKVQSQELTQISSITQRAAVEALTGPQDFLGEMLSAFDERRKYVVGRLNEMPQVGCPLPKGAFYVYPDVSAYFGRSCGDWKVEDSMSLCEYLLEDGRIACVPGAGFGTREHIRISYASSMEILTAGMDRLAEALDRLG